MRTKDEISQGPALILIRGLPGSGKSYLAQALQKAIGTGGVVILDPDTIDRSSKAYRVLAATLKEEGVEEKFYPNRFLKLVGYKAIDDGKIIIWNQAFTSLEGFGRSAGSLQEHAQMRGIGLPTLVVEVAVSEETAQARIAQRVGRGGHDVPEDTFPRFIHDYVSFADKGYNVIAVDGEGDVQQSVEVILKALEELFAA